MALNIGAMLKRTREEVEFPKPLPPGIYYGKITGRPKFSEEKTSKNTGKQFVMVHFPITLEAPGPGVDPDLLNAAGNLTTKKGDPKTVEHKVYLDDSTEFRVWLFLESFLGKGQVADWHSGFEALIGRRCQVVLTHSLRDENDPESNWHNVDGCLPHGE